MPSARATSGSLHSVFASQRTKPFVSLSRLFYLELCFLRSISELFDFFLFGRVPLGRASKDFVRFRTSCGWFPFGSCESLALYLLIVFLGDACGPGCFGLALLGCLWRTKPCISLSRLYKNSI